MRPPEAVGEGWHLSNQPTRRRLRVRDLSSHNGKQVQPHRAEFYTSRLFDFRVSGASCTTEYKNNERLKSLHSINKSMQAETHKQGAGEDFHMTFVFSQECGDKF